MKIEIGSQRVTDAVSCTVLNSSTQIVFLALFIHLDSVKMTERSINRGTSDDIGDDV